MEKAATGDGRHGHAVRFATTACCQPVLSPPRDSFRTNQPHFGDVEVARFLVAIATADTCAGRALTCDEVGGLAKALTLAPSVSTEVFKSAVSFANSLFASLTTAVAFVWTCDTADWSALVPFLTTLTPLSALRDCSRLLSEVQYAGLVPAAVLVVAVPPLVALVVTDVLLLEVELLLLPQPASRTAHTVTGASALHRRSNGRLARCLVVAMSTLTSRVVPAGAGGESDGRDVALTSRTGVPLEVAGNREGAIIK